MVVPVAVIVIEEEAVAMEMPDPGVNIPGIGSDPVAPPIRIFPAPSWSEARALDDPSAMAIP
jgi:hypothetical protein